MRIILALLLCIVTSIHGYYDEKVALEDSYTNRIQATLDQLYGKNKFLVRVDVTLSNPSYEVKYTKESNAKRNKKSEKNVNILPGYPAIKNLNTGQFNQLPFDSVTTYRKPVITRVNVDIFADKSMTQSKIARASEMVKNVINVNQKRIKINAQRIQFFDENKEPQDISIVKTEPSTLESILSTLILLALLGLLGAYIYFQRQQVGIQSSTETESDDAGMAAGLGTVLGGGSGSSGSESGGSGSASLESEAEFGTQLKRYFHFITDSNFSHFLSFVKREKMNINNIAVIASFLRPKLAARLISEFKLEDQSVIAIALADEKMVNRDSIEKLESHIKNGLECLMGGDHVFQNAFNYISSEIKQNVLNHLSKSNVDGYKKVRKNIIMFEDLKFLEAEDLQILISEINMNHLSIALISASEDLKTKIISGLTGGARNMIEQFIEYRGGQYSKKAIEMAQEELLIVVNRLENDGRFQLKDKIKG